MEKAVFNALVLKVLIGQADIAPDLAAQLRKFPLLQTSRLEFFTPCRRTGSIASNGGC